MRMPLRIVGAVLVAFGLGFMSPIESAQAEESGVCGEYCDDDCPSQYGFWNGSYYETQYYTGSCYFLIEGQVMCEFTGGHQGAFRCTI